MALEGTLETPLGKVPKKTALLIGGGVALLGVVWYRSKKTATNPALAGANIAVDPATGYAYGSEEDAYALANQGAYVTPGTVGGSGGGGGGAYPTGTPAVTSNAQWAQQVEQYLAGSGGVEDITALSAAIGKYLTGQEMSADQKSLVEQAIAFGGYPPVSGPLGYPPSIHVAATTPTPSPVHDPAPGTTYITKAGDTVSGIAYYFGRSVQEIQHANPNLPGNPNQPLGAGISVIIPVVYRTF